jgi:hypothetical protein
MVSIYHILFAYNVLYEMCILFLCIEIESQTIFLCLVDASRPHIRRHLDILNIIHLLTQFSFLVATHLNPFFSSTKVMGPCITVLNTVTAHDSSLNQVIFDPE